MATNETGSTSMDSVVAEVRGGTYGAKINSVEPGGAGFIPLDERHGKPHSLFWTWMSPNLEFTTVYVGVIAVLFFGLTIWQGILAVAVGNLLGSVAHGFLSARGPAFGVPQMVMSRIPFGYRGNILPAGLNTIIAGIGWFAVNSVSGAFALSTLTGISREISLVLVVAIQIIIAFFGHNFIQAFERIAFPLLALAFILAIFTIVPNADVSLAPGGGGIGGFLLALGTAFGYSAGWNPYAADYTRYLSPNAPKVATGVWAGLGVFVSCTVLMSLGVVSATLVAAPDASPTDVFTSTMPSAIAAFVLLAIVIGGISANAINIYSGSMSFVALGFGVLPERLRRAMVALILGALGGIIAFIGLSDISQYQNFLFVIAYWVGPWLGVVFADWFLRRRNRIDGFLFDKKHNPWAGFLAMALAMILSIWLFSNQVQYVGIVPTAIPEFGDSAFEFGFIFAIIFYAILFKFQRERKDEKMVLPKQ